MKWFAKKHHWSKEVGVNKRIDICGTNNRVFIGSGASIYNLQVVMRGNNNLLSIGKNCSVSGFIEIIGDSGEITIGNRSMIAASVRIIAHTEKKIEIGEDCMIADLTDIRTTDSHSILNSEGERINHDKDIKIGDRVWITREVVVLKGSIIGSDSVIGIRSIVNKEIPANSLAVGNPARVVQKNITWSV